MTVVKTDVGVSESGAAGDGLVHYDETQALSAAEQLRVKSALSLDQVTNDVQTKAAVMPNTAPAAGRIPVGNAGGTAYVPLPVSGDATLDSTGKLTVVSATGAAISGGTITNVPTPTNPGDAANKQYVDGIVAAQDAMVFKGVIDCSANPNYPAADRGHTYRVSVAGKIGGAAGVVVENGDLIVCQTDGTASGDQATVGANWAVAQANIDGAVIGPATSVSGNLPSFNGTGGKLIQDSGVAVTDLGRKSTANSFAKTQTATPQALTSGVAADFSAGQNYTANVNGSTFTVANPVTAPADGSYIAILATFTTANSLAFGTKFKTTGYSASSTGKDHLLFRYDLSADLYYLVGVRNSVNS